MPRHTLLIVIFSSLLMLGAVPFLFSFGEPFWQGPIPSQAQSQSPNSGSAEQPRPAAGHTEHRYHREPPDFPLPPTLAPKELIKSLLTPDSEHAAIVVYSLATGINEML